MVIAKIYIIATGLISVLAMGIDLEKSKKPEFWVGLGLAIFAGLAAWSIFSG